MSDPLEDRLRAHFAGRAAQVRADPNPGALMERTVGRSGRRVLVGVAALAVVLAGSAALAGAELAGGGSSGSASSAARPSATVPSTTALGGAGASVAPSAAGGRGTRSSTLPRCDRLRSSTYTTTARATTPMSTSEAVLRSDTIRVNERPTRYPSSVYPTPHNRPPRAL